ncbi:MAG: hypothetical protein IPI34_14185 [bacterium]|nr:hypothetical protein [bacterium]
MAIHEAMTILSSKNHFAREEAVCLETCGDIELYSEDIPLAERYYNRAIQVAGVIDNSSDLIGGVLMRKAISCNKYHDYKSGLEYARQSMALLSSMGLCHDLGITYRAMSESYLGLSNYPVSYKYIIKSISTLHGHESMRELALSHLRQQVFALNGITIMKVQRLVTKALAELVIESYNLVALDNRTLYEQRGIMR